MASIVSSHNIFIFETFCPTCHKNREVNMDESIVGKKDLNEIYCSICGRKLSIETLKYLFRKKGQVLNEDKYYML